MSTSSELSAPRPWHQRRRTVLGIAGAVVAAGMTALWVAAGAPRQLRDALAWSALAAYGAFLLALLV